MVKRCKQMESRLLEKIARSFRMRAVYDVTCDGGVTLTLPAAPQVWQHVNVINVGRGVCTVAAGSGIGNGAPAQAVTVAAGAAGRYVFDGTVWRVE